MSEDPLATQIYGRPYRAMHYDRDGQAISIDAWVRLRSEGDYWRVALDKDVTTPDGRRFDVSTVWVGIDVDPWSPVPLIFESMVFRHPYEWSGEYQTKYATLVQAREGHAGIVHILRTGTLPTHE